MDRKKLKITEITDIILRQMEAAGYAESTRNLYKVLFHRLHRISKERGDDYYSTELGNAFVNDDSHIIPENTERYHHERTLAYARCIKLVESFISTGQADWTPAAHSSAFPIDSRVLRERFEAFLLELAARRLKSNTIEGYRRFTYYFIEFLEAKGYTDISDIRKGDVITFIAFICTEKYKATSLGAHMPGLKIFLSMYPCTKHLLCELPKHLPKKRDIIAVYSDEEYGKIISYLNTSKEISFRNKAITILALDTGLRAVDICGLKLCDIDWSHNSILLFQEKTGASLTIPLTDMVGNALVDYILNERPATNSPFVFLKSIAPFHPLISHSGIRKVLFNAVNDSDIQVNDRIYGTRITRHSMASRMLRNGVPMPVISDMLGHKNKDSVMVYITTDDAKLAKCTLPLPRTGGAM